jgi:hypothetical protein
MTNQYSREVYTPGPIPLAQRMQEHDTGKTLIGLNHDWKAVMHGAMAFAKNPHLQHKDIRGYFQDVQGTPVTYLPSKRSITMWLTPWIRRG